MKKTILSCIMVITILTACGVSSNNDKLNYCSETYTFKTFLHHSSIDGLFVRLMQNTPTRIQLKETGNSISMFYCNFHSSSEILLATYDIEEIFSNHDNDVRPSITTIYSENQINDFTGAKTIRLVQKIRDFSTDFTDASDKQYYIDNNLENLPFVLSTPCTDSYVNKRVDIYNFSTSLSAVLTLIDPPSAIQLVEKSGTVQVFYCVFNETSDRALFLGTITILDKGSVDYENALSSSGKQLIFPISENNQFGLYFVATLLPYVNKDLFDSVLHTSTNTERLISDYENLIYRDGQMKLKFNTEGVSLNNPY